VKRPRPYAPDVPDVTDAPDVPPATWGLI
jgi:hypothetical protein